MPAILSSDLRCRAVGPDPTASAPLIADCCRRKPRQRRAADKIAGNGPPIALVKIDGIEVHSMRAQRRRRICPFAAFVNQIEADLRN